MLCFNPNNRIKAIEACAHVCFIELRDARARQPENVLPAQVSPDLLQYTPEELSLASAEIRNLLVPLARAMSNLSITNESTGTNAQSTSLSTMVMQSASSPHK